MTSNRVLVECFNGHPNTIDVAELNMHQSRCCAVCDQPLRYPLSQIIEEAFGDAVAFRPTGWRENEPAYRLPTAEEARDRLLKAIAEHGYLTRASGASPSKRVERLETERDEIIEQCAARVERFPLVSKNVPAAIRALKGGAA